MKVVIFDKNKEELDELANEMCEHYFKIEDVFFYKFTDKDELYEFLYKGYQYRFIFLDEESSDIFLLKTIEELLPECPVIIMTKNKDHIPLNNNRILYKPYDIAEVYRVLQYHVYNTFVRPVKVPVDDRNAIRYIWVDDIYYIDSYYGKVYIHTFDKTYVGRSPNFYYYEVLLERFGFLSIHKSILVQMSKIKLASLTQYTLNNDIVLKPSVRRRHVALNKYQDHIETKLHYYRDN